MLGFEEIRAEEQNGANVTAVKAALQLIGMEVVIKALGLTGEFPLAAAFVILALYTYSAGLRAPALIAFVKDVMIYIVVLVAVTLMSAPVFASSSKRR